MSTTPQAKPTADDLEREKQYAKIAATTATTASSAMIRRRGSSPSHNAWICFNAASFAVRFRSGTLARRLTTGVVGRILD